MKSAAALIAVFCLSLLAGSCAPRSGIIVLEESRGMADMQDRRLEYVFIRNGRGNRAAAAPYVVARFSYYNEDGLLLHESGPDRFRTDNTLWFGGMVRIMRGGDIVRFTLPRTRAWDEIQGIFKLPERVACVKIELLRALTREEMKQRKRSTGRRGIRTVTG